MAECFAPPTPPPQRSCTTATALQQRRCPLPAAAAALLKRGSRAAAWAGCLRVRRHGNAASTLLQMRGRGRAREGDPQ